MELKIETVQGHCIKDWSIEKLREKRVSKLNTEELMHLNCGVGEDSWESLGLQGDPTSPS